MSSRLGARLAALLVPATLLLPVAAHAETVTVDDPAGDAKALNLASELGFLFGGPATQTSRSSSTRRPRWRPTSPARPSPTPSG